MAMRLYDIHYHLIPDIDDGPAHLASTLEMVQISYDQGVRTIVATPHFNHPAQFRGNSVTKQDIDQEFETLSSRIHEMYPDMAIYLGAEVYLSRKDLNHLDQVEIRTMNGTQYVLVEFSRDITLLELDHGIHELMLLGYRPILAHAEVYKCFEHHTKELMKLREQGMLVQCSTDNILGHQKPEQKRAIEILRHGLVDIIASDGHNTTTRRPNLASAYTYVTKKYGAEEAERLFMKNPQTILEDGVVEQPTRVVKTLQHKKISFIGMTSILAVALLGISLTVAGCLDGKEANNETTIGTGKEATAETSIETNIETGTETAIETPTNSTQQLIEKNYGAAVQEATVSIEENALKMPTMDTDPESNPALSDYDRIVSAYEQHLTNLEVYYRTQVDVYFGRLKEAAKIEDASTRDATVGNLQNLIGKLESQSDNEVYKSLYDFQNDLEAKQYDVAMVQQLRDHYNEVKATVSATYQAELEAYYTTQQGE